MVTWGEFASAEPEFAARVQALFDAHLHKTIATLRADGSPRISGIECRFDDGELVFGSMADARKGADLRRDPRFALHSATVDPVTGAEAQWPGEAKIAGRALLVPTSDAAASASEGRAASDAAAAADDGDAVADADSFRADVTEVVHTHLNPEATLLVVEWWTPEHGLRRVERE